MSRKLRRLMILVATLALATTLATPVSARTPIADIDQGSPADKLEQVTATVVVPDRFKNETAGIWIVRLDGDPVASYGGGVNGLAATSPKATGVDQLDASSAEAQEYAGYLAARRTTVLDRMSADFGRAVEPRFTYETAFNGFSVWLTPDEALATWKMNGVASVEKNRIHTLDTDNGPAWIGAPAVWDGTAVTGVDGFLGEGMVAGIIDSGINPSNPSFADIGGDGYDHTNPYGEGIYFGACDPANESQYDPTFVCNDKLVGAYDFFAPDDPNTGAYDADGHGSHTASTTAGNFVTATLDAPTINVDLDISGVAPHANIISYRVCGDDSLGQGSCTTDGIVAAIEQATIDQVDVINYSIGSPSAAFPWDEADDLAFLGARDAGIFVAHSAGNEGPDAATSGSPNAPWMTHVAAFTHDRAYTNALINMTGGDTTPPADIAGLGFTSGFGPAPIVFAGDYPSTETSTPELCGVGSIGDFNSPWEPGTFNGEIVVCQRGTFGRVEKGANVLAAGAGGYVLVDNGAGLVGDPHELPGVHIPQDEGENQLIPWLQSGEGHMAEIAGATREESPDLADILAGFSSRGPNPLAEWMMPTLGAPGVSIVAAHGKYDAVEWTFLSGTSMSSPHVAGAAALLSGITDWSPAEMQSALSLTANPDVFDQNGDPANPFDTGSGRIDIVDAANAGFVLDETTADYLAANPLEGGDPADLNLASFYDSQCVLECTFTRTLTSASDVDVAYTTATEGENGLTATVTPDAFTLPAGGEVTIEVTFDVSGAPAGEYHFGSVHFTGDDGGPVLRMPAAIQPTTGDLPVEVMMDVRRNQGSWLVSDVTALEITELSSTPRTLAKATQTEFLLGEDPTNGDPYDNQGDGTVEVLLVDVPAGTVRMVAEVIASESPDLDLWVGLDANGDGIAQESEQIAFSASGTAFERVDLRDPEAGTYWVLLQNWSASDTGAIDAATLATALVGSDSDGSVFVDGPTSVPELEPFDLRIGWDLDAAEGDVFYGLVGVGTDAANPTRLGDIAVTLHRLGDDVVKTASSDTAGWTESVDFTITVAQNTLPEDQDYVITDTVPEGFVLDADSVTASAGSVEVDGDTITWTGTQPTAFGVEGSYSVTTNASDPGFCTLPFTGGYTDLALFGIGAQPGIEGDTVVFSAFAGQNPFEFYGDPSQGINFTDDGFAFFDSTPGASPWQPTFLPTASDPNDLMAIHWTDQEIVYDAAENWGVSLASAGPELSIIEYDNLTTWPAGGSDRMIDIELVARSTITPDTWEFAFAYANVMGDWSGIPGVVGVENETGTAATQVFAGDVGTVDLEGLVICFDYEGPTFADVEISYTASVDKTLVYGGELTNDAVSSVSNPFGADETTSTTTTVLVLEGGLYGVATDGAMGDIFELVGGSVDPLEIRHLFRAWFDLWASSYRLLWSADGNALDYRFGARVFPFHASAVMHLMQAGARDGSAADAIPGVIEDIVNVDGALAELQLDRAYDTGADPGRIAAAEGHLEMAYDALAADMPAEAIYHFQLAWEEATAGILRLP